MKTLNDIINDILNREGSAYTNIPGDAGGPTKYGITLATLHAYLDRPVTALNVQNITEDQARAIYYKMFITDPGYDKLNCPMLVEQLVDAGVQHGVRTAITLLERALGTPPTYALTVSNADIDGMHGRSPSNITAAFIAERLKYYGYILDITKNKTAHSQWQFAAGWFNRMSGLVTNFADELTS